MLIAPGKNLVCTADVRCPCGRSKATKDAIYMCEEVTYGGPIHKLFCSTDGCDSFEVALTAQRCGLCACCFKPLDDGDLSLVEGEIPLTYDEISKLGDLQRERRQPPAPIKKPDRVLV